MKVVIAVDGSDIAERTFDWYFESIHKQGNEVFIVHHSEPPKLPTMAFSKKPCVCDAVTGEKRVELRFQQLKFRR